MTAQQDSGFNLRIKAADVLCKVHTACQFTEGSRGIDRRDVRGSAPFRV